MDIRSAEATDREEIALVARTSLSESYGHFINEDTIVDVVEEWYSAERLGELLDDENDVFVVAEDDDEIVGFAQGALVQEEPLAAELYWLHVAPSKRDQGAGVQLLGTIQDTLEDRGAAVFRGMVLDGNEAGAEFYEDHGFERADSRPVEIGDREFEELVYEKPLADQPGEQVVEAIDGPDGQDLYVNYSEAERGARGPFYTTFSTRELDERYGFYCGNCRSIDNTMDSMGRIVCGNCGNKRKATRWDASYL